MNSMETSLSSLGRSGKDVTGQSIVRALDEFVGAINRMQEVVMIPSRLKDVEAALPISAPPSRASSSGGLNVFATSSPSPPPSLPLSASPGTMSPAQGPPQDLFTYYRMLDSLKQELVSGEGVGDGIDSADDELSSVDSLDLREPQSQRLAANFRHHLHGLNSVIHQLTATANAVSHNYSSTVRP